MTRVPYTSATLFEYLCMRYNLYSVDESDGLLPPALTSIRKQALHILHTYGFPTKKSEDYRYTPFVQLLNQHFAQLTKIDEVGFYSYLNTPLYRDVDAYHIFFEKGRVMTSADFPLSLSLLPLSKAYGIYHDIIDQYFGKLSLDQQDSFVALNTLLFDQVTFLYLQPNTRLTKPIVLHHPAEDKSGGALFTRFFMIIGEHSRLTLIEHFPSIAKKAIFKSRVAEIVLRPHADLDYYHLNLQEAGSELHMNYTYIEQGACSQVYHYNFSLGSPLLRHHLAINLAGYQSQAYLYGMYRVHGKEYVENNTIVAHKAPATKSHQVYKGIASDYGKGVFRGSIQVSSLAQKTIANQQHHAWLLDGTPSIHAQPCLAIQADDVQCSHGATISQPDEEQLFYLATRGIKDILARDILVQGFLQTMVEAINYTPLKHYITYNLLKPIA